MITASDLRPMERNTLRGFVTLALEPSGIVLHDCTLHRTPDGREWIGLPGKPKIDTEGRQRRDPLTGKPLYALLLRSSGARRGTGFRKLRSLPCAACLIRRRPGDPSEY